MILQKEKIIFIHIPKNAGQSVETFFGRKWTPSEQVRQDNPEMWPETFPRHTPWTRYQRKYKTHTYRSFAIIRNPWARLVSSYTYELAMARKGIIRGKPNRELLASENVSFADYVKRANRNAVFLRSQVSWLRDTEGNLAVGDLLRFETLADDFKQLARKYELPGDTLPHVNRSTGVRKHYSEYYDDETLALASELYREDIELFGYRFERPVVAPLAVKRPAPATKPVAPVAAVALGGRRLRQC